MLLFAGGTVMVTERREDIQKNAEALKAVMGEWEMRMH